MYSLQNRTKHEVWSETGHTKEHVLGRLQQRTAPSASHMASDHTDADAARMLKIDSSRITVWIPSLTTSHNPNALNAKCQMPNAKASKDHFACHWWTRADQSRFCHASLSLEFLPKRNRCKRFLICGDLLSLPRTDPSLSDHVLPLKSRSDHDGAEAQTLLFTAMRRPSRWMSEHAVWDCTDHTRRLVCAWFKVRKLKTCLDVFGHIMRVWWCVV